MQPHAGTSKQGITPAEPSPTADTQKNIAIVEPHWFVRQLYMLELQEKGYNTISLAGHVELFSLLAGKRMDLVISSDEEQEQEQPERKRLITLALKQSIPLIINTGYPFSWFSVPDIDSIALVKKTANMDKLHHKIRHMLARSDNRCRAFAGQTSVPYR